MRALGRGMLLLLLLGLACLSRSPFRRSPADVARAEPCRYMGTLHKESRQRLEVLRACGVVAEEGWLCMAVALKALDVEFTGRCKAGPVPLREIVARQRALYAVCLAPADAETLDCALIDSDDGCLDRGCGLESASPPRAPLASPEAPRRGRARCGA